MSLRNFTATVMLCFIIFAPYTQGAVRVDETTRNFTRISNPVLLAEGGVAKLQVTISPNTSAETRLRAEELVRYLGKITSAKFNLREGGDGAGIYVGTIEEFPTSSASEGLRIYDTFDGKEAYAIRTEQGGVRLLGATELGVSHAVYRFLEHLGCRWFFQGPAWEILPRVSKLSFDVNETDRPEILSRQLGVPLGTFYEPFDPNAGVELRAWWRRNRMDKSFKTETAHSWWCIQKRFKEEFSAHPDYIGLQEDGKRRYGYCATNPGFVELALTYAREQFDKIDKKIRPDGFVSTDMISMEPNDGSSYCHCENCLKLGNPGNQAFYVANQVAKGLQQSHPGRYVGVLAYGWHCDPPDFPMEPNVYVELTTGLLLNTKYGFDKLLELWPKKCKYAGIYDYWAVYDWCRDRMPAGKTGNTKYVAEVLPSYMRKGIVALNAESCNSWGSQGLGYYLASRILWNSSADAEALKNDFYQNAFGPASSAMRRYYERTDLANIPLVGPLFYRQCLDDLEEAENAAAKDQDALVRIRQLKDYHVFLYFQQLATNKANEMAVRKANAFEMLKWNYRIRNSYMTSWGFFVPQITSALAKEFNEPDWDWTPMHLKGKGNLVPYRDVKVVSDPEETARWFKIMKMTYGEVPPRLEEISFGDKMVLTEWKKTFSPTGAYLTQGYMSTGTQKLALASKTGEFLSFTVSQGTIHKKLPEGRYSLYDDKGEMVSEGKCATGINKLDLKIPSAGTYYLTYDDQGAGTAIIPAEGLRGAFILKKGEKFNVYNCVSFHFYVPKKTEKIALYNKSGLYGTVFGIRRPDGTWVGETTPKRADNCYLKADGSIQVIPVPPGMDGKVWSTAAGFGKGFCYFLNIPNVWSFDPEGVLVPEEVAKRDGLKY